MKNKIKENSGINTRHKPYVIGKDLLQHNLSVRIGNATAKKSTSGITLIALVVTIVVLIILAVISLNLLMNGNIIRRAEQSSEIQAKATELERLELVKGDVAIDNKGKVTVDSYIAEAIKQGITVEDEVEDNGDGSKNIVTDNGYSANIAPDPNNENNVIITIDGKKGELPPRIIKLELSRNADRTNITINVEAKRATKYKYYYKTSDGEYGNAIYEGAETSYTITNGISKDKIYTVKVEAINEFGSKEKELSEKDENPPTADINLSSTNVVVKQKITATVTQRDNESGIDIGKCKWILNKIAGDIGKDENEYTKTFNSAIETIELTSEEEGKHYLHVLTVDKAGNKIETKKGPIEVLPAGPNGKQLITSVTTTEHDTITGEDKLGNQVVIPGGFKHLLGNTVQDGIVIQDEIGNEFVWVPVSNINGNGSNPIIKNNGTKVEITLGRYENFTATNGKYMPKQYGSGYSGSVKIGDCIELSTFREGSTLSASGYCATAFNLSGFVNSVSKNKGYYIARYEASYASGTGVGVGDNEMYYKIFSKASTSFAGTSSKMPVGKLFNYIDQPSASKISRNMYYGNEYVQSDLVNGYMWDTAIIYIQAMGYTNYAASSDGNGGLKNTGSTADQRCHIFDMASNLREWTTESGSENPTTSRLYYCARGGSFISSSSFVTSYRCGDNPSVWSKNHGNEYRLPPGIICTINQFLLIIKRHRTKYFLCLFHFINSQK